MTEDLIPLHLFSQVMKAARPGSEREVVTVITRPMWCAFLRAVGVPEYVEPTEWLGCHRTQRVFGSETHVYGDADTPEDFLMAVIFNRRSMAVTDAVRMIQSKDPRAAKI